MKNLRRASAVAILTLTLAVSAFAGTIDSPGIASTPPSQTSSSITTTVILTILSLIR